MCVCVCAIFVGSFIWGLICFVGFGLCEVLSVVGFWFFLFVLEIFSLKVFENCVCVGS